MSEKSTAWKRLKSELDELRLQFSLGKSEAVDFIEDKKNEFVGFIDEAREQLDGVAKPFQSKTSELRQSLDELKLQLKLGRMESRDSIDAQKEKIESSLDAVSSRFGELEEACGDAISKSRRMFARRASAFGAKLELMTLKLSSSENQSDEEINRRHAELQSDLEEWLGYLEGAADEATEDSREAWESVRNAIRKKKS